MVARLRAKPGAEKVAVTVGDFATTTSRARTRDRGLVPLLQRLPPGETFQPFAVEPNHLGFGDRGLHDPRSAPDREQHRGHHLRRAYRSRCAWYGARVRAGRPGRGRPGILEAAYTKGERAKDDVIRDVRTGVQRGQTQASEATTRIEEPMP